MRSHYIFILTIGLILTVSIFLISCSSKVSKLYTVQPDTYLSPKYEDESFKNVSMDICYPNPQYELVRGSDTAHIQTLIEFDEAFKEYFPDAIMLFSTITKVGWVFFEVNYEADIPEYHTKTKDSLDFYVLLPDSLTKFQRESDADFLFLLNYGAITANPPDSSNARSKYSTIYEMEYLIWDRKNLELVAMDKVSSKIEFDRLVNSWPYRASITKSAALIFDKLPMFEK